MILFRYPQAKHRRALSPGPFSRYQDYKPFLKDEFRGICVYCRLRESMSAPRVAYFTVDHYIAKKVAPHLECIYSNLFYACPGCNIRKSTWPRARNGRPFNFTVPNPCDHVMDAHLQYDSNGVVVAKSEDGRKTIEFLDLNSPEIVAFRRSFLTALQEFEETRQKLREKQRYLKKQIKKNRLDATTEEKARHKLAELEERLSRLDQARSRFLGN